MAERVGVFIHAEPDQAADFVDRLRVALLGPAPLLQAEALSLRPVWPPQVLDALVAAAPTQAGRAAIERLRTIYTLAARDRQTAVTATNVLRGVAGVRTVYPAPALGSPSFVAGLERNAIPRPISGTVHSQTYLLPNPDGVGARSLWQHAGGAGEGVHVYVLERGWTSAGPELAALDVGTSATGTNSDKSHGAKTLGVLFAADVSPPPTFYEIDVAGGDGAISAVSLPFQQAPGVVGIVPKATPHMAAAVVDDRDTDANELQEALALLEVVLGTSPTPTVLLVELEFLAPSSSDHPWLEAVTEKPDGTALSPGGSIESMPFDLVPVAADFLAAVAANGVPVVVPMGNAGLSFGPAYDAFQEAGNVLAPVIRVASAYWNTTSKRWVVLGSSNYASGYTTCFGPGQIQIADGTTWDGVGNPLRAGLDAYGQTSAASAVIAGIVAQLLGIQKANGGPAFDLAGALQGSGAEVYLSSTAPVPAPVGLPDAGLIGQTELGLGVPDVYLRDRLTDTGEEGVPGSLCLSPDILIFPGEPTASPGTGYVGTGEILAGSMPHVAARLWNRGTADAHNVLVRIFYASPSTLSVPDSWNYIGSCVVDTVPMGGGAVVSPAIPWDTSAVGTAHYCFIAEIAAGGDVMPDRARVQDGMEEFSEFVRGSNNVAWRNFNIVPVSVDVGGDFEVELELDLTGGPGKRAVHRIWVDATLPEHAAFELVGRRRHLERLLGPAALAGTGGRAAAPLDPRGRSHLGKISLSSRDQLPMVLRVRLKDPLLRPARVSVVQSWRDREVGRITWMLVPR